MRIGVFVCHCGSNIGGTVDCAQVAKNALGFADVVYATDLMYTCAEPGQAAIEKAIHEHNLTGVVVASCSPRMHEPTFRRTVERAGLNRYMFEMANIREHVSWIGKDKEANTNKATELVSIAVAKLRHNRPLQAQSFDINKRVLIIGGGVAGIQAALDCADAGIKVLLVEREPTIGGKMAKLDKTFPTVDCAACILGPKMVDVSQNPNITLYACSEVQDVSGYVGNFDVTIKKRATYVDWSKCTGCGTCTEKCPTKNVPDHFNENVGKTTAINIPFPQAIPKRASINPQYCKKLTTGKCGVCAKVCPTKAINYEMKDELITEKVGCIIAATGYDLMDWTVYEQYGGGKYPDVITSLQYERLLNASGPTGGHIVRPSDGKEPKKIAFIQCVGSRDPSRGRNLCSGFCCMYTAKQAVLTKDHIPDSQSYVFYMDIRDLQLTSFAENGSGRMITNGGKANSYGVELSLRSRITDGLTADLNYGFTRATFRDYIFTDKDENSQIVKTDCKDNFIPYTPRHTVSLGLQYTKLLHRKMIDQFIASAQFTGAGKIFWTEKNDISQPFYGLVNAKVGIRKGIVNLNLWSRNITNTDYQAFYFESFNQSFIQKGKPFQIGGEITVTF